MVRNFLVAFLAFALVFSITACGSVRHAEPTPSASVVSPTSSAPGAETLEDLLLNLTEDEIGSVSYYGVDESVTAQTLVPIIRAAAAHTVDHAAPARDGSDTLWSMDLYMGEKDQWVYSSEDSIHFCAGLEENIVEVSSELTLADRQLWLEDEALYQLLRTQNDGGGHPIDQDVYDVYRETVDAFLNEPLSRGDISLTRELVCLEQVDEVPRLGAKLYLLSAVLRTNPPEQAVHLMSGGEYVDSRLRIHTVMSCLVVVDGEAVGVVGPFFNGYEGWLESFDTKEALIEHAKTGRGTGS